MPQTFITGVEKCTLCNRDLSDLKILIKLNCHVFRETSNKSWESVDNSNVNSNEMLCKECFDKFVDTLDLAMTRK